MNEHFTRNKKPFTIREAVETDAAAIEDVVNSVAAEKYFVVPESSREDWDEVIKDIKSSKGLIIVAQVDANIVGMATLARGRLDKNRHTAHLGMVILKEFRGIGIGKAIMNYLIEWARKQEGLEKICLTVFSTNKAALNLYQKFGFKIEGISKKQYKIERKYVDDIMMGKLLT